MLFLLALLLQAQQGVAPAWDTPRLFSGIAAQSGRLQPILRQIKPKDWIAKGAPQSQVTLWESAVKDNLALATQAKLVAVTPDKLSDSLKLLVQLHQVDEEIAELLPALSQYQNPALAELIAGVLAEGQPMRAAFDQRVMDLANDREEQLSVADHEAQRCRATLSKEPRRGH